MDSCAISRLHADAFKNNKMLTWLRMEFNNLTSFEPGTFSSLTNLTSLRFTDNRVRRLNSNSFGLLSKLSTLYMSHSEIDEIEPGFFENFPNLSVLAAVGNPCVSMAAIEPPIPFEKFSECFENWVTPRTTQGASAVAMSRFLFFVIVFSTWMKFKK